MNHRYDLNEAEVVEYVDDRKFRRAKTERVLEDLLSETTIDSGLLPPAIRWIAPDGRILLLERPPFVLPMQFHRLDAHNDQKDRFTADYDVPIPWTVTFIDFLPGNGRPRAYAFARNGPVTSLDDTLGVLPLPNQHPSQQVCFGTNFEQEWLDRFIRGGGGSLSAKLALINSYQWSGRYNMDLPFWCDGWRMPKNFPDELRQLDGIVNPGARANIAMAILRHMAETPLPDVLGWKFAPSKQFNEKHDRVRDVIAKLVVGHKLMKPFERFRAAFNGTEGKRYK